MIRVCYVPSFVLRFLKVRIRKGAQNRRAPLRVELLIRLIGHRRGNLGVCRVVVEEGGLDLVP